MRKLWVSCLSIIANSFPNTPIDAVVYPGDIRKINSIKEITDHNEYISVIEKDICGDTVIKAYDIIIAHLLLGEATKFGHSFEDTLNGYYHVFYQVLVNYGIPSLFKTDNRTVFNYNRLP